MTIVKYSLLNKQDNDDENVYECQNQGVLQKCLALVKHKQFAGFFAFCMLITTLQLLHMRLYYDAAERLNETTIQIDVAENNITITESTLNVTNHSEKRPKDKYFIYTSQCRMPYVDPFGEDVLKIFNPQKYKYTNCTKDEAFITSNYHLNVRQYFLHIEMEAIERAVKPLNASATNVHCCYRQIVRSGSGGSADTKYKLLNCVIFHQDFLVPSHIEYIITECYLDHNEKKPLQKDAFSFIQAKKEEISAENATESQVLGIRKPSVLLIGIDAVSRINLRRTMPQTFKYLQVNEWAELLGYNKVNPAQSKYYIYTSQCRVPYVPAFTEEALKVFKPENYKFTNCTNDEAFISTVYQLNAKQYILHMDMEAIERAVKPLNASATDVRCCYRQIVRAGSGKTADKEAKLLNCTTFEQDFLVPIHVEYMVTECYVGVNATKPIQADAFSFIQPLKPLNSSITISYARRAARPQRLRKPSILLVGIDSISRINLRRTMPMTAKYLEGSEEWIEFHGLNKVGDNTFPNLMPLLTSYNTSMAYEKCKPSVVGGLNQPICNFIWDKFKEAGYITAYSEDVVVINTYNYKKIGFEHPPTDYYMRPMTLAIEKALKVQSSAGLPYCVGRRHYGDYIFDSALQYANVFTEEQPTFGLFWMNSFSHNAYDTAATMDVKVLEYLKKFKSEGILERSIVLFFSDHGVRWGPLVKLTSGFLEERLPMFFISLPPWYQKQHPDFIKTLKINQKRLTTPYDIYATLKHILEDADPEMHVPYVNGSTPGLSIFHEIPENRTCKDADIPEHWCTCVPYEVVPTSDAVAKNVTGLVLNKISQYLVNKNISDKCAELKLTKIESVEMKMFKVPNESTYRISFEANPEKAKFRATVVLNITTNTIETNVEEISRLDSYAKTAKCIDLKEEQKYCLCRNTTTTKT